MKELEYIKNNVVIDNGIITTFSPIQLTVLKRIKEACLNVNFSKVFDKEKVQEVRIGSITKVKSDEFEANVIKFIDNLVEQFTFQAKDYFGNELNNYNVLIHSSNMNYDMNTGIAEMKIKFSI